MSKKIGNILLLILILCAVLAMMASNDRKEPGSSPSVNAPTQQTIPAETKPQISIPDAGSKLPASKPAPDSGEGQNKQPDQTAFHRVRTLLDQRTMNETACSVWVWNPELNPQADVRGTARESHGWALAQFASERKMNPIAGFWVLVTEKVYTKTEDTSGRMTADAFTLPEQAANTYSYTEVGATQLITDLLTLAAGMEDGLELESGILGSDGAVSQISLAREEGCWYGYFIIGGERSTHILCFYLRPDGKEKQIADVEFQLLNLCSAQGSSDALAVLERRGDTQAAALMAAAELLLTGRTQANTGDIPYTHMAGFYTATVERFRFTADGETGTLTNYRLRR